MMPRLPTIALLLLTSILEPFQATATASTPLTPEQWAACATSIRDADEDRNAILTQDEFKTFYGHFVHHCPLQLFLTESQVKEALANPPTELADAYSAVFFFEKSMTFFGKNTIP